MKQDKILFEKYKKKMPNRPPNEIDFGLGFGAALDWVYKTLEHISPTDYAILEEELGNEPKKD